MQLRDIADYIFYCFYRFFLKIGKKDSTYMPELQATTFIGVWEMFYLLNIGLLYRYIFQIEGSISYFPYDDKIIGIGGSIFLIVLDYFLFMRNKRYEKIFQKFSNRQNGSRIYLRMIAIAFFILPLIGLYFLIFHSGIVK